MTLKDILPPIIIALAVVTVGYLRRIWKLSSIVDATKNQALTLGVLMMVLALWFLHVISSLAEISRL